MKIKGLFLLLIGLMILSVGCNPPVTRQEPIVGTNHPDPSEEELNPKEPVKIVLWHYYVSENQQVLEQAVNEFNQTVGAENGVIVESIAKGSILELETAVSNSAKGVINSEPMPDIFSSYPDKAIEIAGLGMIADLNTYFTPNEQEKYVSNFLTDGIMNRHQLLILPIVKSTEVLYLNGTAWKEFSAATGIDLDALRTWEGIYETARQYYFWTDKRTPDIAWDGESMIGLDSIANYIIIGNKQLGKEMIDASRKEIVIDLPILRRAFDVYVKAMAMEYFNAGGKFRSDNMKSGDLIGYTGSSSSVAYFPTWIEKNGIRQDIELIALPYPKFAGGNPFVIQQGAGMCVAKSNPKSEKGAVLFLKWFTEKDQNLNFAMNSGYLPVAIDAYRNENFQDYIHKLHDGTTGKENIAAVYEVSLEQISTRSTYAAKPFDGSYKIRSILQSTLTAAVEDTKNAALELKANGLSEEQILQNLNMDARFELWVDTLKKKLSTEGVAYR